MNISFLEPAENELQEAIDYYQEQRQGLGDEFLVEILLALERIQLHPLACGRHCQRERGVVEFVAFLTASYTACKVTGFLWRQFHIYTVSRCIG
jgi:hypothetical protein